jgi:DNA-binding CsgD family transcriptional regulator
LVDADFTETPRQRQVLDAVAQGLENKEIAENLGISEQRAKELVSALLKKFGVKTRSALAHAAVNMRILGSASNEWVPYSYFFDEAPILMAVMHGPHHRYALVNSAFVRAFGDRHYVGRTARECFPEAMEEAFAGLDRTYGGGERYEASELRRVYAMPDGQRRELFLSFINEPIRSASNEISGLVFYGWDLTAVLAKRRASDVETR